MNDNPVQSNLPEFGHLPSTGILRQQPPSSVEIAKTNKRAKAKADFKDFILFCVFAFVAWLFISLLVTVIFGGAN